MKSEMIKKTHHKESMAVQETKKSVNEKKSN